MKTIQISPENELALVFFNLTTSSLKFSAVRGQIESAYLNTLHLYWFFERKITRKTLKAQERSNVRNSTQFKHVLRFSLKYNTLWPSVPFKVQRSVSLTVRFLAPSLIRTTAWTAVRALTHQFQYNCRIFMISIFITLGIVPFVFWRITALPRFNSFIGWLNLHVKYAIHFKRRIKILFPFVIPLLPLRKSTQIASFELARKRNTICTAINMNVKLKTLSKKETKKKNILKNKNI